MADRRAAFAAAVTLGLVAALLAGCGDDAADPADGGGERMNVVLILSDDQAPRSFREMPYTSSRRWTRFTRAFLNNPLCCPSRATILTGLNSHNTGVEVNEQAPGFDDTDTVATWLQDAGYRTGFIGKYLNDYPWGRDPEWRPPGWDRWVAFRDQPGYYDYALNVNGEAIERGDRPEDYSGRMIERQAERFLGGEGPFFLLLAPFAPHGSPVPDPRDRKAPVAPRALRLPPSFNEADVSDKPRWIRRLDRVDPEEIRDNIAERVRTALSVDRLVRRTVRQLKRQGEWESTVLIFLTDNGYALGEHRYVTKNCPYDECIRTPLLVHYPGARPRRIGAPVSNADLAPTIAAIAGAEPDGERDGESLLGTIAGGERLPSRRAVLLRNALSDPPRIPTPPFWGVRTARYKYVEIEGGERELYDLRRDPHELDNLAGERSVAALEHRLARRLERLRGD